MPKKYSCEKLAQGVGSVRRGHITISIGDRLKPMRNDFG